MPKRGTGRKRVNIERMENASARQVTFSKRRSGLFKKGSELCTLCGAEVAMLVFSPGGKLYSFGHPCLESVIDKFLGQVPQHNDEIQQLVLAQRMSKQLDLNRRVTELKGLIEAEDIKSKKNNEIKRKMRAEGGWWEKPLEELKLPELEALKASLGTLHNNVVREARLLIDGGAPSNSMGGRFNPLSWRPQGFNGRGRAPIFSRDNMVPMDTRAPGSSTVNVPNDPITPWFNEQGPYDHMVVGSSHGVAIETMDKGKAPYDPMAAGSGHWVPLDTRALGFSEQAPYNPLATRSSHGLCIDTQEPGFNQGAPYEATRAGSSSRVLVDTWAALRVDSSQRVPFEPWSSRFNNVAPYNLLPMGSSQQATFDPRTIEFNRQVSFDAFASDNMASGSGAPSDARANGSSTTFQETSHSYGHFSRND